MSSKYNDTANNITVTYCADPNHAPDCPGEVTQIVAPGEVFTYDETQSNGPKITSALSAAKEVVI